MGLNVRRDPRAAKIAARWCASARAVGAGPENSVASSGGPRCLLHRWSGGSSVRETPRGRSPWQQGACEDRHRSRSRACARNRNRTNTSNSCPLSVGKLQDGIKALRRVVLFVNYQGSMTCGDPAKLTDKTPDWLVDRRSSSARIRTRDGMKQVGVPSEGARYGSFDAWAQACCRLRMSAIADLEGCVQLLHVKLLRRLVSGSPTSTTAESLAEWADPSASGRRDPHSQAEQGSEAGRRHELRPSLGGGVTLPATGRLLHQVHSRAPR